VPPLSAEAFRLGSAPGPLACPWPPWAATGQWHIRSVLRGEDGGDAAAVESRQDGPSCLRSTPPGSTCSETDAMVKNLQVVISRVRAALMRRGRTRHDAEDLVQEAWVRLACYERQHAVEKPEAFLMRTALNLSIDDHRTSRNHGEQVLLDDIEVADAMPPVEAVLLAREGIARLSEGLADLDPKTRRIFLAHRVNGQSYVEIARDNRLSVSAVEKHIAKAALLLARSMEGWWP
jgi:RNA polymerase sigma factor (sigma-70 family)